MKFLVGLLLVFGCVFGGYVLMGGKMYIIIQAAPFELLIILGSGIGAFVIANPGKILKKSFKGFGMAMKGPTKKREECIQLLCLMYQTFKMVKSKGALAIEAHVEKPEESTLFNNFPLVKKDHHVLDFFCDYLRLWTLGTDKAHEMEAILDQEIEIHHHEHAHLAHAYQSLADALPALGIVAAVLGVIKTMASITEPPEILGKMIGGALVGTFLGVFLAYGIFGPLATFLNYISDRESDYYKCIKAGLIAHMQGYAPAISVEFARKSLGSEVRPTFFEVEAACSELPPV